MKYLKIEEGKGYFLQENAGVLEWIEIVRINGDHLMYLLNAVFLQEFKMDVYDKLKLADKAHQIIYKNVFEKFREFLALKLDSKSGNGDRYKEVLRKYGIVEHEVQLV